jgi:protein-arginine kinase activator protein McsA
MKSGAGKSISIDPAKHAASAHAILGCKDCHTDIKEFPASRQSSSKCNAPPAMPTKPRPFPASAHSALGDSACASCHGSVHELTTAEKLMPGKCTECHAEEVTALASSIHGQAAKTATPTRPNAYPATDPSTP